MGVDLSQIKTVGNQQSGIGAAQRLLEGKVGWVV
jgi:hypothetical protein